MTPSPEKVRLYGSASKKGKEISGEDRGIFGEIVA